MAVDVVVVIILVARVGEYCFQSDNNPYVVSGVRQGDMSCRGVDVSYVNRRL